MNNSSISILVIGGYGGVGKILVESLVRYLGCEVVIGGRSPEKGAILRDKLLEKYAYAQIRVCRLDATERSSLLAGFSGIDLAIVAATIPDHMTTVAEAALEAGVDLMDILLRGDVVDQLAAFREELRQKGRRFITQCGFHPGLCAPMIRLAAPYFDDYREARVFMAMDAIFEQPESARELFYEVISPGGRILENGMWRKAGYKDALDMKFLYYFGQKSCYPLQMKEIYNLDRGLGLQQAGVYAAGFDRYIDNFIFPLAIMLGWFGKKFSERICTQLFFNHIKDNLGKKPRVEMVLKAKGLKEREEREVDFTLLSDDGFRLTALPVVALLKQYSDGLIRDPGLHLMGEVVQEERLFRDLKEMGVVVQSDVR
ncbi:MAG: saccharopine dehydrogenase NADP-binding domain-containing protein [Saprospiraceae bacterium]